MRPILWMTFTGVKAVLPLPKWSFLRALWRQAVAAIWYNNNIVTSQGRNRLKFRVSTRMALGYDVYRTFCGSVSSKVATGWFPPCYTELLGTSGSPGQLSCCS